MKRSSFYVGLIFFVLFSWYFSHSHIHTSPMYLVCPFLFVCVSRASDKKRAAINICFYVRRQKLLRCVMSTFKYKLLGLRSHVNANLIAFTGILYFDFVWAWPCMCVCVYLFLIDSCFDLSAIYKSAYRKLSVKPIGWTKKTADIYLRNVFPFFIFIYFYYYMDV